MFRSSTDVVIAPRLVVEDEVQSDVYVCDLCTDGWLSETEVEIHRANTHRKHLIAMLKRECDNVCRICIMKFEDKEKTIRHIKSEHLLSSETAIRVERDIYICDLCCEIYFNKALLIIHLHSAHMSVKRQELVECPNCARYLRICTMWYHFRTHRIQSVACCRICCKKFKDRYRLNEHLKTHVHNFRCEICGYETKKAELFRYHIVSKHKSAPEDVKDTTLNCHRYFMPRHCDKKWRLHGLMGWKGLRLSNSVRICVLCREICVGNQEMRNHILLEHMVTYPEITHDCICGLKFTSKVVLKQHLFKSGEGHKMVVK